MSLLLASLGFGLVTAAVLAIASVGFTMQFAVTDVLNLAYGAVMIVSAYVAYAVNQAGSSVWLGVVAAAVRRRAGVAGAQPGCLHTVPATGHVADRAGHRRRWA